MYQAITMDAESPSKSNANPLIPCSIVVSNCDEVVVEDEAKDTTDNSSKRLSIVSNSSIDSSRSDNCDGVNIEYGSSVFYVTWD